MLQVIIHHIRTFYVIVGFRFWVRLFGYSFLLGIISAAFRVITTLNFSNFMSGIFLDIFGWGVLLILSRFLICILSKISAFNKWFFGENFDYQAAYDGYLDGHIQAAATVDMTEQYRRGNDFYIYLGDSNDYLYRIGAGQRMGKMKIALNLADSCQNYMITGGIGSGKTVCAISPILFQLLDPENANNGQNAGGLIFDIKGDFKGSVYDLAARHGRIDITTIGVGAGQTKINIIRGLSPQIASAFIKSAFEQTGGNSTDSFWIDSSIDALKAGLTILQKVELYTLNNLYLLIFDKNFEATILNAASELSTGDLELIAAIEYYKGVYLKNEERTLQSIKATIGTMLSNFTNPQIVDSFCNNDVADTENLFIDIVEKGRIILLDLPFAVHGYAAKIIYVLLKLRFMNLVQTRPTSPDMNQDRPVFFVCDEYQNAITSKSGFVSDVNFWDKSRSAKCIGVISFQTVSSLVSALNGDRATTETILANFRQKIFFANEDPQTCDYIQKIAGKFDEVRTTTTKSESKKHIFEIATKNTGTSTTVVETQFIGAEDIRSLQQGVSFAILRINNTSFMDLLSVHYCPTDINTPAPSAPQSQ